MKSKPDIDGSVWDYEQWGGPGGWVAIPDGGARFGKSRVYG